MDEMLEEEGFDPTGLCVKVVTPQCILIGEVKEWSCAAVVLERVCEFVPQHTPEGLSMIGRKGKPFIVVSGTFIMEEVDQNDQLYPHYIQLLSGIAIAKQMPKIGKFPPRNN